MEFSFQKCYSTIQLLLFYFDGGFLCFYDIYLPFVRPIIRYNVIWYDVRSNYEDRFCHLSDVKLFCCYAKLERCVLLACYYYDFIF